MKRISKNEVLFLCYQIVAILLFVVVFNLALYLSGQTGDVIRWAGWSVVHMLLILWFVFAINNYLLVSYLYNSEKRRIIKKIAFWLINTVFILFLNHGIIFNQYIYQHTNDYGVQIGFSAFVGIWVAVNYVMISLAIGRHAWLRQQRLKAKLAEEKQRNTEAELAWLKNQLNPHFLFNTLNNISSLTQIDPDMAQDKIGQLSDLLRYALYDSREDFVPLTKDVDFMRNYIDLMSLRCGPNVDIKTDFDIDDKTVTIAPMIFLSPIENAFKHGVSASKPSFIHISLRADESKVTFVCDNSNYPKDTNNHSGSGIGVGNMKRRLELIYPNRYSLVQKLENNIYSVSIQIKK